MTDKELMQQALEALENSQCNVRLRAYVMRHNAVITALRDRLAQPDPEPVAWMYEHDGVVHDDANPPIVTTQKWLASAVDQWTETPLYTAPQVRRPLTDEQAVVLADRKHRGLPDDFGYTTTDWFLLGVRQAERAHGIGGSND